MIAQLALPIAIVAMSPFVFALKANLDQQAINQEKFFKNQLKMSELSKALLDAQVCTDNLKGKSAATAQNVEGLYYLNTDRTALDTAKKIMLPKYSDSAKTMLNPAYDASGIQTVRLVPPTDLTGTAPGDALVAYLEVEIEDPKPRVRAIPIYFEYDAANLVSRCSARRRVRSCP